MGRLKHFFAYRLLCENPRDELAAVLCWPLLSVIHPERRSLPVSHSFLPRSDEGLTLSLHKNAEHSILNVREEAAITKLPCGRAWAWLPGAARGGTGTLPAAQWRLGHTTDMHGTHPLHGKWSCLQRSVFVALGIINQ